MTAPLPSRKPIASGKKSRRRWLSRWFKSWHWDQWFAVGLILFWGGLILANFAGDRYIFEGNLIAREVSFTYAGVDERRFLNPIRRIQQLDIEGSQPEPFVLTGTFSSPDNPALNQQLAKQKQLTLELPEDSSRVIVAPATPDQKSALSLLELRIQPDTQVNQLKYERTRPQQSRLSFCLQSTSSDPELCSASGSSEPVAQAKAALGTLALKLGQQPLTVTVDRVNIPELAQQAENASNLGSFQVVLDFDEKVLSLRSPARIYIDLPDLQETDRTQAADRRWFWEDFDVRQVRFLQSEQTDNVTDEIETSSILEGEVRMGSKLMDLQANQFLIVTPDDPGIRKLRSIQIHPDDPMGLQTLISGESSEVAAGFYQNFPVETIKPSLLSKYPQEAVNALLAFIAALTGFFLPRLFTKPSS